MCMSTHTHVRAPHRCALHLRGIKFRLSGVRHVGVYERLMLAGGSHKELEIVRDLSRTYPSHVYYQQRQGPGQRSLFNVLRAYSIYDRQASSPEQ